MMSFKRFKQPFGCCVASCLWVAYVVAQTPDTLSHPVTLSAYAETYYSYDFDNPGNRLRPSFTYNHNRHNEFNINLALVKAQYTQERVRANLALMTGTYSRYNLATEPFYAQFINEANMGYQLFSTKNVWIDVGVMPSHLGLESAIGATNWTLTRSIVAENSPYYEAGARLSYQTNKWYMSALWLNGWQRIFRYDREQRPSVGTQLTYTPNSTWLFNYSTFFGYESTGSTESAFRQYHNFYISFTPTSRWGLQAGIDIGNLRTESRNKNIWATPLAIVRYKVNERVRLAARWEYLIDDNFTILSPNSTGGHTIVMGNSLNADVQLSPTLLWRTEIKRYGFLAEWGTLSAPENNVALTTSLCLTLPRIRN